MARLDFDSWADELAAEWVRDNPQLATMSQYFSGNEQDALDRQLGLTGHFGVTYGKRAADARSAVARHALDELATFDTAQLSDEQRASAAILEWRLRDAIANAPFAKNRFIFSQMIGLHVGLVSFLTAMHPVRNERDAENYIARLAAVAPCLEQGTSEAVEAAADGVIPPRFILERTIEQFDKLAAGDPSQQILVASFGERLSRVPEIVPQTREKFLAAATTEVRDTILPAFKRVRATLADQLSSASNDAGAWALPNGAVFYKRQLESLAGTSLSPDEIHSLGRREVARIEAEMDAILKQLGHRDGSIDERIETLNEQLYASPNGDPRAAILQQLQTILSDAGQRAKALFNLRPKSPVELRREPEFSERSAAAHYSPPAPDGTRPGIYWVPLADVGPKVPWLGIGMKSTAYHEAIPGHHFQLAIEQEAQALPYFRRRRAFGFDSSYGEGWALYAEQVCGENGWYEGDLPAKLGYLEMQLFRARRLVVDTGLHHLKWTREQAIEYGITPAEVERYITWPGQACSYMLGQLRILELRERARKALGNRFSINAFHDLVLGGGTMPLDVLARRVDAWAGS